MKRREFIIGGAAAAWPLAVRAQLSGMPVVGFLSVGTVAERAHLIAAFHQGFSETGFIAGQTVEMDYRWAGDQFNRLPGLASELVARPVAVILAGSNSAARAAKSKTSKVPIIFVIGSDPVKESLVESLNRPGGNATGTTFIATELQAKRLEVLHELVPSAQIATLRVPNNSDIESETNMLQAAARRIGLQLIAIQTSNDGDLDATISDIAKSGAGALLIVNDPFFANRRQQLVALVARYRIPTMYDQRASVEAGGLVSYGASQPDAYRQAGIYVGRVLKGDKPAELPVQAPAKFELVINLKTANALGLTISREMMLRADELLE